MSEPQPRLDCCGIQVYNRNESGGIGDPANTEDRQSLIYPVQRETLSMSEGLGNGL